MVHTTRKETAMSLNVAARAGRWSASHWKTATFGWIAFVVAAVVLGGVVGTKQLTDADALPGESGRASKILDEGFPRPATESVLVQSRTHSVEGPAFRRAIEDVVSRLRRPGRPLDRESAHRRTPIRSPPTAARRSSRFTSRHDLPADRAGDGRRRGGEGSASRAFHRWLRRGDGEQGDRPEREQGSRARRPALGAGDDRRPSRRLRGARGRRHPGPLWRSPA